MANVKTVRDAEIKTFQRATSFFYTASLAQTQANAVKVCNNTYLSQERDLYGGVRGYALTFHGQKTIIYHTDGSYTLQLHSTSPTTRRRVAQFSPFTIYLGKEGCMMVRVPDPLFQNGMRYAGTMFGVGDRIRLVVSSRGNTYNTTLA